MTEMTLEEAKIIAKQSERSDLPRGQALKVLVAEVERLTKELHGANKNHEHFEREWYLAKDNMEDIGGAYDNFFKEYDITPLLEKLRMTLKK